MSASGSCLGCVADFQIVLYENDNSIRFNYRRGITGGSNVTAVGIENRYGSIGLRYKGLSSTRSNIDLSVLFYLGAPGTPDPEPDPDPDDDPGDDPDPDDDGDKFTVGGGDCNDNDPTINPDAEELCGDGIDNNCNGEIDEDCDLVTPTLLYFPLLAGSMQETYFGLLNNSGSLNLSGSLQAYNNAGDLIGVKEGIELNPLARQEFALTEAFAGLDEDVAYVTFAGSTGVMGTGYCRFVDAETMQAAAYPAVSAQEGSKELYLPTIIYKSGWSTEIGFVSISNLKFKAEIVFNNGATSMIILQPYGHQKIVVSESMVVSYNGASYLLGELPPTTAATVKFSFMFSSPQDVVVGAVLYRDEGRMGAAVLSTVSDVELIVPYLVSDEYWWSSLAFYNPGGNLRTSTGDCLMKMSSYGQNEMRLIEGDFESSELGPLEAIAIVADEFPPGTCGLKVENECGVVGLEFVGKSGAVGCFAVSNQGRKSGVFARVQIVDKNIWSGIVLLNPGSESAEVVLVAYDDNGHYQGEERHHIEPFTQLVGLPEDLFQTDISQATSIRYVADQELVGLVLNNQNYDIDDALRLQSNDSLKSQLDILPALLIESTGSIY